MSHVPSSDCPSITSTSNRSGGYRCASNARKVASRQRSSVRTGTMTGTNGTMRTSGGPRPPATVGKRQRDHVVRGDWQHRPDESARQTDDLECRAKKDLHVEPQADLAGVAEVVDELPLDVG